MAGFSLPSFTRVLHGLLVIFMVSLIVAMTANGRHEGVWDQLMGTRREMPFSVQTLEGNPIRTVGDQDYYNIRRDDFPKDFAFGASTSALQIEGSLFAGGRGPSVREVFIDKYPDRVMDGSNLCRTIDSYRRYKEDVQYLVQLGVQYYRFSISWPRILPGGSLKGGIRQDGIDHYNSLIDELVTHGITPVVTLLHFDLPQALEDEYGGFLSSSFVNDFKDYAEVCFNAFGDRVKHWITMNEPYIIAYYGYDLGLAAPGRCSPPDCPAGNSSTEPYIVSHNMLLAHATAYKHYKKKFNATQGGQIGISLLGEFVEPYDPTSSDDIAAARRVLDFIVGWYVEPLTYGHYPKRMRDLVGERLPKINKTERELLKGSTDFIGINYYSSTYAKNIPKPHEPPRYSTDYHAYLTAYRDGVPIGPEAEGMAIYFYPQGLQELMEFMDKKYQHPSIYITENGITEANVENRPLCVALNDKHRIHSIKGHLYYLNKAMKNGADVKGYFYWALFDDFEWLPGFGVRFGFFYIDYKNNLTRIPKLSSRWFKKFLTAPKLDNGVLYD